MMVTATIANAQAMVIQIGDNTHIQEQSITPVNFNITRISVSMLTNADPSML